MVNGKIFLSSTKYPERLGAHPASYSMDTGDSFPGREADESSPSTAEVKNVRSCTSTPPV